MNDEEAIRDVMGRWMSATKAGDTASVVAMMTDDAVFLIPARAPFGKEVFRVAAQAMKDMKIEAEQTIDELHVSGDLAYARTRLSLTVTMPDGKTIAQAGHCLTIFRKEAGAWRLARDANLLSPKVM